MNTVEEFKLAQKFESICESILELPDYLEYLKLEPSELTEKMIKSIYEACTYFPRLEEDKF
ncbi:hypothetical protein M2G70_07345 [Vibrio vulnificus]|nr:hypothetical protein [Vibrio vulnificus]